MIKFTIFNIIENRLTDQKLGFRCFHINLRMKCELVFDWSVYFELLQQQLYSDFLCLKTKLDAHLDVLFSTDG